MAQGEGKKKTKSLSEKFGQHGKPGWKNQVKQDDGQLLYLLMFFFTFEKKRVHFFMSGFQKLLTQFKTQRGKHKGIVYPWLSSLHSDLVRN